MSGWLLDVNMILASRWTTHPDHLRSKSWVDLAGEFHTCAITELGFIRISLSSAYRATWDETQEALAKLQARPGYRFLVDDVDGASAPKTDFRDTTDAHLIALAKRHGLMLATLDAALVAKPWAAQIAQNPLLPNTTPAL